jgi:MerR family transcriptional regulator, light-induced transcriptional regulator
MTTALLNIAALSRRTGVAPDTLRKWELRYGVLRPVRTAGGQRRYSEADVQRVEWLRDRIRDGWRIGEAARVIDGTPSATLDEPDALREMLVVAVRENDPHGVSAALDQAFAVLSLEQALTEVVTPALRWTGGAWERGELSVSQEHAITAKVRAHLGRLISEERGGVRGSAVLACAPGEQHDIGLLMLAVMLRGDGWRVEFLGADTPVADAVAFAGRIGAAMLCLSASRTESVELLRASLRGVEPPGAMVIAVGGAAVTPEIAGELEATYADERLGVAVERLRAFAAR